MKTKLFLIGACIALPYTASAQQALVSERTLSLDAAIQAAQTALETCRKSGYNVTVAVLNKSGRLKAHIHDDNAGPHTLENSFKKAYSSITFKQNSGDFGKRVAANPHAFLQLKNVTTAEGALLIKAGEEIVGAIGVSGAPGGDKDAVCAQAGIDRIKGGGL